MSDKLKAKLGWEDIDIPGETEFSEKYYLSGKDKEAVLAFWTPERIARFKPAHGGTMEANGKYLALYKFSVKIDGKTYPAFIEDAKAVAAGFAGGLFISSLKFSRTP